MQEIEWRDIAGYEGFYQVSNTGQVRSLDRVVNKRALVGKIMKPSPTNGYERISLSGKSFLVHRLVLSAFIDNQNGEPMVNHKNGIKSDNRLENLEWSNPSHNMTHAIYELGFETASKKYDDIHFLTYATCLHKYTAKQLSSLMNFVTFRRSVTGARFSGVSNSVKQHFKEFPVPRGPARRAILKQLSEQ